MLPKFLRRYFWDVDFREIAMEQHKFYIIKRILEFGDEKAIRWMIKNFALQEIKDALCNFRDYSLKTANFWALVLGLEKDKVRCLNKSFQGIQRRSWNI